MPQVQQEVHHVLQTPPLPRLWRPLLRHMQPPAGAAARLGLRPPCVRPMLPGAAAHGGGRTATHAWRRRRGGRTAAREKGCSIRWAVVPGQVSGRPPRTISSHLNLARHARPPRRPPTEPAPTYIFPRLASSTCTIRRRYLGIAASDMEAVVARGLRPGAWDRVPGHALALRRGTRVVAALPRDLPSTRARVSNGQQGSNRNQ